MTVSSLAAPSTVPNTAPPQTWAGYFASFLPSWAGGKAKPPPPKPRVKYRLSYEKGRVRAKIQPTLANKTSSAEKWVESEPEVFAAFKGGGKRRRTAKISDPSTARSYHYSAGSWSELDAGKLGGAGAPLSPNDAKAMNSRLASQHLVDRTRAERSGPHDEQHPLDVGGYAGSVDLGGGKSLTELFAKQNLWGPTKRQNRDRDHIVSKETLNQLNAADPWVGDHAVTIAIPSYPFHKKHSPTYGSRRNYADSLDGVPIQRQAFDKAHPAQAQYRDATHMITQVSGADHTGEFRDTHSGQLHRPYLNKLDLTNPLHQAALIGAYRTHVNANAALHELSSSSNVKGKKRKLGADNSTPGMTYTTSHSAPTKSGHPKVHFHWTTSTGGQSQGEHWRDFVHDQLTKGSHLGKAL